MLERAHLAGLLAFGLFLGLFEGPAEIACGFSLLTFFLTRRLHGATFSAIELGLLVWPISGSFGAPGREHALVLDRRSRYRRVPVTNPAPPSPSGTDGPLEVPLVDLAELWADDRVELDRRILEIIDRAAFVGGPSVQGFERAFAEYLGVSDCVGVASGTDALELALRSCGLAPEAEVLVPAFTFVATVEAVRLAGARPRLVDVSAETGLIDLEDAEAALTERTRAIVPVHLYGQMAPMPRLMALAKHRGLRLIEDAAQAHGARQGGAGAGSVGDLAAFSFYPTKNLGGIGDGGAIVTRDLELAARARLLANHGRTEDGTHALSGRNSRLDALQAVALALRLQRLDTENELRRHAARRYAELLGDLGGLGLPAVMEPSAHVFHLYVVRTEARDALAAHLRRHRIGHAVHYRSPIHLMPAHRDLGYEEGAFPRAEQLAREVLALPMHPRIRPEQQEHVASIIRAFWGAGT